VPQSTILNRQKTIDVNRKANLQVCEQLLRELPDPPNEGCVLRVASQFGAEFFADIWVAILVGTICRRHYFDSKIISWGQRERGPGSTFAASLPGLTAIQLSDKVRTDVTDQPIDIDEIEYDINRRGGILEPISGKVRTLVEFDPQSSIAPTLRAKTARERERLFTNLILMFRQDLELGYKQYGISVHSQYDIGILTKFLTELHDNAFLYSRTMSHGGLSLRGLRIVRIRAHLAATEDELIARAANNPLIQKYLHNKRMLGVMEAAISDFGHGIVDHFLSSETGAGYEGHERRELLHALVHKPLSSQTDPGAGHGLPNVLKAARSMGAFISLRTGEFWLAQSFSDPEAPADLVDVPGDRAKVAGTHWQLLWPMGL